MLDYIRGMGARVVVSGNSLIISGERLKGIHADLSDCIDLLPTMAVLAALAEGNSVFMGIDRARIKESDRVAAVKEGLNKMGVNVVEEQDRMIITGLKTAKQTADDGSQEETKPAAEALSPEKKESVVIKSYGDHRIAMAFAVAGAAVGGYTIEGAECVTKTFPGFWDEFTRVGGEIKKNE
jgi:3-phosphoshikimate 1-carboxyvinyltransferase